MEKKVFVFFVFLFMVNFVFALGNWETINLEEEDVPVVKDTAPEPIPKPVSAPEPVSKPIQESEPESQVSQTISDVNVKGRVYTSNFYIALVLMFLVLVIIGIFIWLFIRDPKNKWEK